MQANGTDFTNENSEQMSFETDDNNDIDDNEEF
jgi:hypothetical protein